MLHCCCTALALAVQINFALLWWECVVCSHVWIFFACFSLSALLPLWRLCFCFLLVCSYTLLLSAFFTQEIFLILYIPAWTRLQIPKSSTTLSHVFSYFLTCRLSNIFSYFFTLSFNRFLSCKSPSPKLSSVFFVRKEPEVGDKYHTDRFRLLCDFFLDIRYRKCKTCHWCDVCANFFTSILRYLRYSIQQWQHQIRRN
jgi:hypothetical protein